MYAFDQLERSGEDLRPLPLLKRKSRLKDVLAAAKRIRFVEHVGDGLALFAAAQARPPFADGPSFASARR